MTDDAIALGSRRIFLDTETTGSSAADRVIEIGLVETIGTRLKPRLAEALPRILDFVGEARIFAHNAAFDSRMLEAELALCGLPGLGRDRYVCTVKLARRAFPGVPVGVDALLERLMPGTRRGRHSALEDARLVAMMSAAFLPERDEDLFRDRPRAGAGAPRAAAPRAPLPARGAGVSPELAAGIAAATTGDDAYDLRTGGRDAWSSVDPDVARAVVIASGVDEAEIDAAVAGLCERRVASSLRWMCRGLGPELAAARERMFEGDSPSP
ncbi:MAG: hypothetical protein DI635_16790 [Pseudoxanthomonas suwonensis]|nr:MAG: hypothetical protein DI635_16790 [Pseudoxanthomonas suwonensis]